MNTVVSKLTILFEEPFWIGIYERENNGQYEVCKITFGAEPKDYEVYDFLIKINFLNTLFLYCIHICYNWHIEWRDFCDYN